MPVLSASCLIVRVFGSHLEVLWDVFDGYGVKMKSRTQLDH